MSLPTHPIRPHNPEHTTLTGLTYTRFGLFPVRSPLLRESQLISFPAGTEMFQFPAFASYDLCIQSWMIRSLPRTGFPIRKSPDQSLFSGSPKLIAACHVLHRLLAPRHPPYALSSLTIKLLLVKDAIYFSPLPYSVFKEQVLSSRPKAQSSKLNHLSSFSFELLALSLIHWWR